MTCGNDFITFWEILLPSAKEETQKYMYKIIRIITTAKHNIRQPRAYILAGMHCM